MFEFLMTYTSRCHPGSDLEPQPKIVFLISGPVLYRRWIHFLNGKNCYIYIYIVCMNAWSSHIAEQSTTDQSGKAANPDRGQLNREKPEYFLVPVRI